MPQPRRDEAVETGARAILHGATIDSFYAQGDWGAAGYDVQQSMLKAARDALEAALAILQPTVPSEVDALEALPVGTVLRGDAREEGVIVAHLTCLGWTEGEVPYDSTRLLFRHADLLGIDVLRPHITETTALGAAYLAGLAVGFWPDTDALIAQWQSERVFTAQTSGVVMQEKIKAWQRAVRAVKTFAQT